METFENKLWFPRSVGSSRPSPWWYYGRAIFVSRHDYKKIFYRFFTVGVICGILALIFSSRLFWGLAFFTAYSGLTLLLLSLLGLYLQYGHFAKNYFRKLLSLEPIPSRSQIADIHIGTYRHSYILSELMPDAKIYSVDCKQEKRFSEELAVREVQALEETPLNSGIETIYTSNFGIPLPDNCIDAVVFGFGTHEIPETERCRIFAEAKRILKPEGKVFLFEHGIDPVNYLIFGPVIFHVTGKKIWQQLLAGQFRNVRKARLYAVNLFSATNLK